MQLSPDDVEMQCAEASYSDYVVKVEPGTLKVRAVWVELGQNPPEYKYVASGSVVVCFGPTVVRRCSFELPIVVANGESTNIPAAFRGILASLSTHVLRDLSIKGSPSFIAMGPKIYTLYEGYDQTEFKKITRAIEF